MTTSYSLHLRTSAMVGAISALSAQVFNYLGASFAKALFPIIGATGVTSLRVALAALLMLGLCRPWKRSIERKHLLPLSIYGATLGFMNLLIYEAFARIPIGIATGIEVLGPLAVVLFGSRRLRDLLWFFIASAGVIMLLPLETSSDLDPVGLGFAFGAAACWALYIISGKQISASLGRAATAWGMLIAATLVVPLGIEAADAMILSPWVLLVGVMIAIFSSALPYSLEMEAMRRLPAHAFSILLSASPGIAAVIGFLILGEVLTVFQWLAVVCIMIASIGCILSAPE